MVERTGSSRGIPSSPRRGLDDTSEFWGSLWAWPPATALVSGMYAMSYSCMSYSKSFTTRPCPQEGHVAKRVATKVPEMSLSAHSVPISAVQGIMGVDQQGRSSCFWNWGELSKWILCAEGRRHGPSNETKTLDTETQRI